MNKTTLILVLSAVMLLMTGDAQAQSTDQYMVMFKGKGVPNGFAEDVSALGGSVVYSHDIGFAVVRGIDNSAAVALGHGKNVQDIQIDESFALETVAGEDAVQLAGSVDSSDDPTGASRYSWQWNMQAINAEAAWSAGRLGSPGVTVAILDTGIDYTYPDLAGRVDLSRSISFAPDDDPYVAYYFPGKHPITDIGYHGTHVASTVVSNGNVIAGVTSQITLIGVKVCSVATGGCAFSSIISGVLHAVDSGADVANMSLGGSFAKAGNGRYVGFINKVFNYANSKGMVIVVSAGNAGADLDHDGNSYKSYCSTPNTICVSATGPTAGERAGPWANIDMPASYTNFGRSAINVAAPGGTSVPVWAACSQTSLLIDCSDGVYVLGLGGTSMAAPHVSGLAALVVEDVGRNPGRIKTIIQQGADDLGQRGTDPFYGKGRINVGNTVN